MKKITVYSFILLLFLTISCTPDLPEEITVTKIFSLNGSLNETDLNYPYIYIAAHSDGFWRVDLSSDNHTSVELPLLNSNENITKANYIDAYGNNVIALTEKNIWKSINYGMVWYRSEIGIDRMFSPKALSRSSYDPWKLFFINAGDAMYSTSDWGESWQKGMDLGISDYSHSYWDPYRHGNIWIEGLSNIDKQFYMCVVDQGDSVKNIHLPEYNENTWCSSLWFESNMIYMKTHDTDGKYIIRSADGGYNWTVLSNGIPDSLIISDMCADRNKHGTYYLADSYHNAVYRSTDTLRTVHEIIKLPFSHDSETVHKLYYEPMINSLLLITLYGIYEIPLDNLE